MTQTLTRQRRGQQQERNKPAGLVEVFESAWLLDAHLSREGWEYLWQRYGQEGLIDLGRRSGWFAGESDEQAASLLHEWSLRAGYDPTFGRFGQVDPESGQFVFEESG